MTLLRDQETSPATPVVVLTADTYPSVAIELDLKYRPHRAGNPRPPDCDDSITAPVTDQAAARIRRHKILDRLIN